MRYPLLDPLRGVAAVWVFSHHLVYTFEGPVSPELLQLGYFGVPMFFVISGYCLAAAGRRAVRVGEPAGRFLARRALRVLPPFWAAVAVAVAVYAALPLAGPSLCPSEDYVRTAWRSLDPGEWVGVLTLTGGFRPSGEPPWGKFRPVNVVFWTLAIELQFYAVVGLAVWSGRRFYPVLAGVTAASVPFLPSEAAFSGGWFLPFWPFFALGVGLYAALERGWTAGQVLPGGWGGRAAVAVAGCLLAGCGLAAAPVFPDAGRAMIAGEFAFAVGLTVVLWALWRPVPAGGRTGGLLGYLGAASYTIYLLHVPLMFAAGHAVAAVLPPHSPAFLAATLVGVCILAYPFYRWVERPCMGGAGRPPAKDAPPATRRPGRCPGQSCVTPAG